MPEAQFTDATKGPVRRAVTYLALLAAAVALISTIALVAAALGALPQATIVVFFSAWFISLVICYGATRYLKSDR